MGPTVNDFLLVTIANNEINWMKPGIFKLIPDSCFVFKPGVVKRALLCKSA
jgi:hypothetical protein